MTEKQMDELGFYQTGVSRYAHPHIPIDNLYVNRYTRLSEVLQKIYEQGKQKGIKEGKELFSHKLKELLNLKDDE